MTVDGAVTRRYLEAFFEADYEQCDEIVHAEIGADVGATVDRLVLVTGTVIRRASNAVGREAADVLATLFAQARRERPAAGLVQDRVTARTLDTAPPAGDEVAAPPAELLAELAALLAIVTQALAVVTGAPLSAVLDDLWDELARPRQDSNLRPTD